MGILTSVVIPCHNHARYLRRAVESVLAQTYEPVEIVIVNDGSTDHSHDVAEQLIAEHPDASIVLVDQEQQGSPRAMNVGVAASSGEYLITLGADDTLEQEMLAETTAQMDADPKCGIVYTYTRHRVDPDDPPPDAGPDGLIQEYPDYDFAEWVRLNPQLDACSLVRRKAFDETGGFDPAQYAEDLDLWISITKRGWVAKLVPKPLFNYWHHGGARESNESWMQPIELRWQLVHKHPELYEEGERLFVTSLMLATAAADVADLSQQIGVSAEAGFDWITVQDQTQRMEAQFAGLLSECESIAAAKVSAALGDAIDSLLKPCRQAGVALSELAKAVRERALKEAFDRAEELDAILPRIGDGMVLVFKTGMAEIYGPGREGTGRTH